MSSPVEIAEFAKAIAKATASQEYCLVFWMSACMPRSDWASWVQAVGAVLALVVAVGVVIYQQVQADRTVRERREVLTRSAFLAMNLATQSAREFTQVISNAQIAVSYSMHHRENRFDVATQALANCQPEVIGGELANYLHMATKEFATMRFLAATACSELATTKIFRDFGEAFNNSTKELQAAELLFFKAHAAKNRSSVRFWKKWFHFTRSQG